MGNFWAPCKVEHFAEGSLEGRPVRLEGLLLAGVEEIAALPKSAAALVEESPAFLGLVLGVGGVVPAQLVGAVGKLTLFLVRTEALFHELSA